MTAYVKCAVCGWAQESRYRGPSPWPDSASELPAALRLHAGMYFDVDCGGWHKGLPCTNRIHWIRCTKAYYDLPRWRAELDRQIWYLEQTHAMLERARQGLREAGEFELSCAQWVEDIHRTLEVRLPAKAAREKEAIARCKARIAELERELAHTPEGERITF